MVDLRQKELADWQAANFDNSELECLSREELIKTIHILQMALGIAEEAGEIAHHVLKGTQHIRGGINGINVKEVVDGVGDCLIYGTQLLTAVDADVEEGITSTIDSILERNWKENPTGAKKD